MVKSIVVTRNVRPADDASELLGVRSYAQFFAGAGWSVAVKDLPAAAAALKQCVPSVFLVDVASKSTEDERELVAKYVDTMKEGLRRRNVVLVLAVSPECYLEASVGEAVAQADYCIVKPAKPFVVRDSLDALVLSRERNQVPLLSVLAPPVDLVQHCVDAYNAERQTELRRFEPGTNYFIDGVTIVSRDVVLFTSSESSLEFRCWTQDSFSRLWKDVASFQAAALQEGRGFGVVLGTSS